MDAGAVTVDRPTCRTHGARYVFRDGIWPGLAQAKGWPSLAAAARAIGVSDTTLARALLGESAPGARLIAALMAALGNGWSVEAVFELQVPKGGSR